MLREATREGRIAEFRDALDAARRRGDVGMVRAMRLELDALGALETAEAAPASEVAIPKAPRRGRKPLPRCEHGMIATRCTECNPEEAV